MDISLLTRKVFKQLFTSFNKHREAKLPIFLFSSARSGSTWLMEMIYSEIGLKYINEPLEKKNIDFYNMLPIKHRWNYLSLNSEEQKVFIDYFTDSHKTKVFGPRNIFSSDFNFFTNRRIFKIIRANSLIEWFDDNLEGQIIYLIRHPIAQSLSCIAQNHHCEIYEYLQDKGFQNTYLNQNQVDLIRKIWEKGTEIEKFVTEWCLDNIVPLRRISKHPNWIVLSYEKLVLEPIKNINLIQKRLNLTNCKKMYTKIKKPSKTTNSRNLSTVKDIKEGVGEKIVSKWRRKVTLKEEKNLFAILGEFNIDVYQKGIDLPKIL
jgi:hypothetical protein